MIFSEPCYPAKESPLFPSARNGPAKALIAYHALGPADQATVALP